MYLLGDEVNDLWIECIQEAMHTSTWTLKGSVPKTQMSPYGGGGGDIIPIDFKILQQSSGL